MNLSPREFEVAAWHLEGREQHEIGDFVGLSQQRVSQIIAGIQKKFERQGVALPKPWRSPFAARHMQQLSQCAGMDDDL